MGLAAKILRHTFEAAFAFLLLAMAAPARAQDHDGQLWLTQAVKLQPADKLSVTLETHQRFMDDVSRWAHQHFRGTAVYNVTPHFSVGGGYGRIIFRRMGDDLHEDRFWQQVGWKSSLGDRFLLSARTRLEERGQEFSSDIGLRLRQRLRLTHPIGESNTTYFYIWDEALFHLNDTDFGVESGFGENRVSTGFGFALTKKLKLEAGYLNQFMRRPGIEARMAHTLSLGITLTP